uniref:HTH CENPB-type domain-containing protein n=1 Tax=Pelodiscus sinensis TaxID=13735 RepID=K7G2I4_PELSI
SASDKSGEKRKRKAIDLEQKIAIVGQYKRGQAVSFMVRNLGLSKSTISTIKKDSNHIHEAVKGSAPMKSTIITKKRTGPIHDMEKLLVLWIEDQIKKRMTLSLKMIQAKAHSLLEKKEGYDYDQTFSASYGWFNRFRCANFYIVKVSEEAASADSKAAETFIKELDKLIKERNYLPNQIFNVDEIGLFWKKMPDRTYIRKEAKTMPGFKAFKDHLTVLLGENVFGYKLKRFLIYHYENRIFKNISKATLPVHYRANNTWMTLALFEDWFMNCFIPEKGIPFKILLILDNAPGPQHLNDLHPNVKVVFLPPNSTSILQPMDQGAIAAFRAYYLRNTFEKAIAATECKNAKTLCGFWKDYNILHGIRNIAAGWEEVTQQCMSVIWKKILKRYVNSFKGFEKEKALEEISNKIVLMAKEVDPEVDKEDL